jgi:hypothetical protein
VLLSFVLKLSLQHIIFAQLKIRSMPKKIKPVGKQISMLLLHAAIFGIVTALCWIMYAPAHPAHWVYPWPAWTTAAWALALLGHFCIVFTSYEDKGWKVYRQQEGKEA